MKSRYHICKKITTGRWTTTRAKPTKKLLTVAIIKIMGYWISAIVKIIFPLFVNKFIMFLLEPFPTRKCSMRTMVILPLVEERTVKYLQRHIRRKNLRQDGSVHALLINC